MNLAHPFSFCSVLICSSVFAAPTVVDSFSTGIYHLGPLVGQAAPATGFTGQWLAAYGGAGSPDVIATGLGYSDGANAMLVGEGAIEYGSDGRAGRLLAQPYTNLTSGSVYFSILMKVNAVLPDYRGFELHQGGFDDGSNRVLQIVTGEPGAGATDSSYVLRLFNNTADFVVDLGESDTEVNLFVGRIDFATLAGADALTIWRNPEDLKSEANSTSDGGLSNFDLRFDRASFARFGGADRLQFDEVRFGTSWSDVTTVIDPADTDSDGILDTYENLNGLTVGVDDSQGDLDMDDSTNLEEFTRNTRANVFDTDGDGIRDGWEDDGGSFVSAMETGTDPLAFDTDGDGLRDGYEDNGGSFVSATATGTNPNIADTDTDGESDGVEVREGTNPNLISDSSAARGLVIVDGVRDALYPDASSVQTIQTGFGDNSSEWNAAYAYVKDGFLNLLLTGNLQDNFNKLEIFIDSTDGGQATFAGVAGNDGSEGMNGMIFDTGFTPDYHLIARRGGATFDLNFADLNAGQFDAYSEIFKVDEIAVSEGSGNTPVGQVNVSAIRVGYNNSNLAGIGGDQGALADQAAALAVTTGLELKISLADLGNPPGEIRVMVLQNNQDHQFLSNQSLGGLPGTTQNLGTPSGIDFNNFVGDQFFSVTVGSNAGLVISGGTSDRANNEFQFRIKGLVSGRDYHLQFSIDLDDWNAVPGTDFNAPGEELSLTVGANFNVRKTQFFRVVEGVSAP